MPSTCRCFRGDAYPDGDLADFFVPDEAERFICGLCHEPLHHETLVRLRRHQSELERTASDRTHDDKPGDWCRACKRQHRWVR